MSQREDIAKDRRMTRLVIDGRHSIESDAEGLNWLRHKRGSMAEAVDRLLIDGATREKLEETRNGGFSAHRSHLLSEHGLLVTEDPDGLLRFDWRDLGNEPDAADGGLGDLWEGEAYVVEATRFERSHEARELCIAAYGSVCAVCGLDFGERYGKDFAGLVEVHHRRPMATRRER